MNAKPQSPSAKAREKRLAAALKRNIGLRKAAQKPAPGKK